jgi:protection of telomeres protein 1
MSYVIWANNRVKEIDLPSDHEYAERTIQAEKPNKDKFSLLRDVKPDHFYNILGEVIKLYDSSGTLTVHLSDYTANKNFYNHVGEDGLDDRHGQDGDEYGYIRPKQKIEKDWPGPFGKMSIQLTLFDEHAQFVRENVMENTWVLLKNVQIKYGRMGGVLEGYMRGDENKMNVNIIKFPERTDEDRTGKEEDPRCKEIEDPNFKPALQRKLEWKKSEEISRNKLGEGGGLGNKRKHGGEGPSKSNSKKRREEKRAAGLKKVAAEKAKTMQRLNLNDNSKYTIFQTTQILTTEQFVAITRTNQS